MITSIRCPICDKMIAAEKAEMNMTVLEHHKKEHPQAAMNIVDAVMEVGHIRDRAEREIKKLRKNVKSATSYIIRT